MEINEIIKKLKKLDLSKYPYDEIRELIQQVGKVGYVVVTFHRGKSVMRARPNYNGEHFEKKNDYSFKPQELNKTYQRASTPNETIFYATCVSDNPAPDELTNMRVIGVAETVPMLRDKTKSGLQKISFGRWYVTEDIHLLAVVHKNEYAEQSSYIKELSESYKQFIESTPKELSDRSIAFTSYLADEFSKSDIKADYDYLISAIFSEFVSNTGLDGVLYPSVRVDGKGFNIAIKPSAVDKLSLRVAGECSIYKLRDHTVVGNDAIVELNGDEEFFKLKELKSQEEECLRRLNVKSVEELR